MAVGAHSATVRSRILIDAADFVKVIISRDRMRLILRNGHGMSLVLETKHGVSAIEWAKFRVCVRSRPWAAAACSEDALQVKAVKAFVIIDMRRRLRTRWRCSIKGIRSFYIWSSCFTFDDDE